MLSGAYESTTKAGSGPMSAPQPLGAAAAPGLGISAPAGVIIGPGPQMAATPPVVPVPVSGVKNGTGVQGMEEEVTRRLSLYELQYSHKIP